MKIDIKIHIVAVDEDTRVELLNSLPFFKAKAVPSVILIKHPTLNSFIILKSRYPHWMLEDLEYVFIPHIRSIDDCKMMERKNVIIDSHSLNYRGKDILKYVR